MIDVLLVSPRLAPDDPRRCGDHAYTDALLSNPPDGVRYCHYEDAIAQGKLRRIRPLQRWGYNLIRAKFLPPDTWVEYLSGDQQPDLVHIIALSATVRLQHRPVPIVLHASSPSITDLTVKRNWNPARVRRAYFRERLFLKAVRAHHYALNSNAASAILVQTDYGRKLLLEYGDAPPEKVHVLYPAQPTRRPVMSDGIETRTVSERGPITFLFVGSDFQRKNGDLVVEAFRRLSETIDQDVRMLLIGAPPDGRIIQMNGVEHRLFVDHAELLDLVFPMADVFVLPTHAEGSFAFTLFEAMSYGLPIITVNAWAMPEIVTPGENGMLIRPDSLDDLVSAMQLLAAQPERLARMRKLTLSIFEERFSVDAHNRQLRAVYEHALAGT